MSPSPSSTTVPFSSLLDHLRTLSPSHTSPTSLYAPVLCAVLSKMNEPELVVELVEDVLPKLEELKEKDSPPWVREVGEQVRVEEVVLVTRVREAMYKAWPLSGFPLAISSLSHLSTHLTKNHPALWSAVQRVEARPSTSASSLSSSHPESISQESERGQDMFDAVYGKVSDKVLAGLEHAHPDMPGAAISLIYGPILSSTRIFSSALDGSMLALALCFTSDLPPQTKGHYHGCLNHHATTAQLVSLLSSVRAIMDWAGDRLRMERMAFLPEGITAFPGRRALSPPSSP